MIKTDNRGSSRRGIEFEGKIANNMGEYELIDQISVLKTIKQIDKNRIGIIGWSYGGYLSAMSVCKFKNVFKVAIAGKKKKKNCF